MLNRHEETLRVEASDLTVGFCNELSRLMLDKLFYFPPPSSVFLLLAHVFPPVVEDGGSEFQLAFIFAEGRHSASYRLLSTCPPLTLLPLLHLVLLPHSGKVLAFSSVLVISKKPCNIYYLSFLGPLASLLDFFLIF